MEVGRLCGQPAFEKDEQQCDHTGVLDQFGVRQADQVHAVVTGQHPDGKEEQGTWYAQPLGEAGRQGGDDNGGQCQGGTDEQEGVDSEDDLHGLLQQSGEVLAVAGGAAMAAEQPSE